jgi:hypothetical protein
MWKALESSSIDDLEVKNGFRDEIAKMYNEEDGGKL